jgi:hypothetical protein
MPPFLFYIARMTAIRGGAWSVVFAIAGNAENVCSR